MPNFTVHQIESALESRILIALLTNDQFLRETKHAVDLGYFKSTYHQNIARFAIKHFEQFHTPIGESVRDTINPDRFKPDEIENYRAAVDGLLERIATAPKENTDYLIAEAIKFFKKRELEITTNNITYFLSEGKVDEAEKVLNDYVRVGRKFSNIRDSFDEELLVNHFTVRSGEFFKMPGDLGRFLGYFERGWLVGIMGAYKTGKSWTALEFGIIGMLSNLNVVFFSLEMTERNVYERIFKRLSVSSDRKKIVNPVFDCQKNQTDECQFARRTNNIALDWQIGEPVDFRKNSQYRICTFCKDHAAYIEHYETSTWFEQIEVPIFDQLVAAKVRDKFSVFFKNRFKFKAYPRYTASIEDIKNDLNTLEVTDGWVPDIIIVDYADILKPEPGSPLDGHEKEDRSWIALSQLAGEKKALVITPTQVTKDGLEAYVLRTKHTARWSGKLGHIDAMVTINQTEEEKRCGIMRIAIMEHRHAEFFETDCCTVLQNLKTAQVHLDSVKTQSHNEGGE
jgi:hypothetical protein